MKIIFFFLERKKKKKPQQLFTGTPFYFKITHCNERDGLNLPWMFAYHTKCPTSTQNWKLLSLFSNSPHQISNISRNIPAYQMDSGPAWWKSCRQKKKEGEMKWQLIAVSCLSLREKHTGRVGAHPDTLTRALLPRDWWAPGHLA